MENENNEMCIHRGSTPVLVIPTNEEVAIAHEVMEVLLKERETMKMGELTS